MLLTDGNGSKKECTKVKPCCRASAENKYIDFMASFNGDKHLLQERYSGTSLIRMIESGRFCN